MFSPQQQLGIAILAGVLGAAYQFSEDKGRAQQYNVAQRIFSMVIGSFLSTLVAYLFIMEWHWNWVVISILNTFFGTGAEKIIRLMRESQNSARSPEEFIDKWKKVKKALNDDTPPSGPDETGAPENNDKP